MAGCLNADWEKGILAMKNTNKLSKFMNKYQKQIYMAPCVLFLLCMVLFPLLYTLYLSFHDWSMSTISDPEFIGLQNYFDLFKDHYFTDSIRITLVYSTVALAIEMVFGIILALMLNRKNLFMRNVNKTIMLIPMTMTPVAVGMIWKLIMDPTIGLFNYALKGMGFDPLEWLSGSATVIPSLIIIDVWQWTPMVSLIILAGLSSISEDINDAATIDGANFLQKTFKITIPLTLNTILVAALLRLIDVLKTFDIIYSTTQGGPAFQSQTINIYSYMYGFQYYKYGYSAASMIIFLLLVSCVAGVVMYVRAKAVVER